MNLVGDYVLVVVLKMSLFGAAAATAIASWVGSALALGMLSRTVRWRITLPRGYADIAPLLAVSGALLVAQVTNSVTYSFTTAVASRAGTGPAAAHQIALQIWWLLSYFPVPLYIAAQSILAGASRNPRRGRVGVHVLCQIGAWLALALAAANAAVSLGSAGGFTADAGVLALVAGVTVPAAIAQLLATVNTTLEGARAHTTLLLLRLLLQLLLALRATFCFSSAARVPTCAQQPTSLPPPPGSSQNHHIL